MQTPKNNEPEMMNEPSDISLTHFCNNQLDKYPSTVEGEFNEHDLVQNLFVSSLETGHKVFYIVSRQALKNAMYWLFF